MKTTNSAAKYPKILISLSCVFGMILSVYAYHVETSVHSDPTFKALCDISEKMSCSKVFSSKYGTGFGFMGHIFGKDSVLNQPNSVYGMIFYITQALLAFSSSGVISLIQVILSVKSCIGCVYLAYVLVYILDDFCVVCVTTYVINIVLLINTTLKYRALRHLEQQKASTAQRKKRS